MPSPAPKEQDLRYLNTYLSNLWARTHDRWASFTDKWYWGEADIWDGRDRPKIIPGRAAAIIDHAADTRLPWSPKVHREPVGTSDEAQAEADDLEEALRQIFLNSMLQDSQLAFKQANRHFGAYGYAVIIGPIMDMRRRPQSPKPEDYKGDKDGFELAQIDYKNAKRQWNPVRIYAPHPARVLMDPYEKNPEEGLFRKQLTMRELQKTLEARREMGRNVMSNKDVAALFRTNNDNPFSLVKVLEYWSEGWHAMLSFEGHSGNSHLLLVERNTYGFTPAVHAFAGFGQQRTNDETNDPRWLAKGLLDPVEDALKAQAQNMSAKHNGIIERGFPRKGTSRDVTEVAEMLKHDDVVLEGEQGEFWHEQYPDMPRWMFEQGRELQEDIDLATYVMDIAGQRQQGVSTVGQQAILSEAAGKKFQALGEQINQMGTILGMNILKLVRRLQEDVSAGGKTLKWRSIRDDYAVVVTFETIDPALNVAMREMGLAEVDRGLISHETYREDYRRAGNETMERRRLIKQMVRQHPAVVELLARGVMQEEGLLRLIEELEAEGQQQSGLVGPNGQPLRSAAPPEGREMLTSEVQRPPRTPLPMEGI